MNMFDNGIDFWLFHHIFMYRYVVELMQMVVEFIQNLDVKIEMVQAIPTTDHHSTNLVSVVVFWLCACIA